MKCVKWLTWLTNCLITKHTKKSRSKNSWSIISHAWFEMTAIKNTFIAEKNKVRSVWLTESITSSWMLIGEACRTVKLPEDRPAASHRPGPEEPCLNYKLGTHLSVTQRNQCTVECRKWHTWVITSGNHNLDGLSDVHLEKVDTSYHSHSLSMKKCNSTPVTNSTPITLNKLTCTEND